MKAHIRLAAALLLSALGGSAAFGADGAPMAPFRLYSVADGLSQSETYDLVQDDAGYLWFTTGRGLNRFDGREFHHWTIADGLPTNDLTALAVAPDHELWVGDAQGGASLLRGGRVIRTIPPLEDKSSPITDILVRADDVLVLAGGVGVLRISDGSDRYEVISRDERAASRFTAFGDTLFVVGEAGLQRVERDPSVRIVVESPDVRAAVATDDALWVADSRGRVGHWRDGELHTQFELDTSETISNLAIAGDGTVYAATDRALFRTTGQDGTDAARTTRYPDFESIVRLFVDREETLWLTSESGLTRALGERFTHFPLRTGNDPQVIWGIAEDSSGALWFATQRGLLRKRGDELQVVGAEHGVPGTRGRDVVSDGRGSLWVGFRGEGLYRIDSRSLQGTQIEGTAGLEVLDVAVAPDGAVWFATSGSGIYRYASADASLERYPAPEGAPVFSLIVADDGGVWFGADEVALVHLQRTEPGRAEQRRYGEATGLKRNLFNQIQWVSNDEVWVSMEEGAVYRFDGERFADLGADRPFSDQSIYVLELLPDGSVLVGGEQGLYQFREGEGTAHYGRLSGFLGSELSVHATYTDSQGYLWLGTIDGASRMDVARPMPPNTDLSPQIVRMSTLTGREDIVDGDEIGAAERGVRIEYAAVSLTSPLHLEFSYKLSGLDNGWSAATRDRSVTYSNVPVGDYEFKVRARFPGKAWHEIDTPRRFSMQPNLWQHPLARLAAVVFIVIGVVAVLASRTRSIRRTNEMLRVQVAERTASIQRAKEKLQESNELLSREVGERRKSDQARAELEARFHRAFQHAPIGMGLLNRDGQLFDANPALGRMLWPTLEEIPAGRFVDTLEESDRERFVALFEESIASLTEHAEGKFACVDSASNVLNVEVNLSTVHADGGDYLYSVLQVLDVTESLKLTGRLEYQAMYDELTGLLNRRAFEAELVRAWEHGRNGDTKSFLMFMDLDQFKVVNDTSGHAAGDELLKRVSKMLVDSVRANDSVGRLGGDEFAIILWKCPIDVAERIAESIRSSVEALRFQWDKETYRVGVSIGGIPIDPKAGDTGELQQLADAACYTAKEEGRNRVHIVAGNRDTARLHRGQVRWVQRLREAMDNNRFTIYGQLITPLAEGAAEPASYEILLRLRDPETRKLIPPGAFLPAAERYGFSLELDEWVVRTLLKALFVYQSFQADRCRYWINLSASSIGNERFAALIKEEVERSQLPRGTVNFELTERAVIRNVAEAGKLMTELREMGCQFALDDVGSGLASFGYLRKLPIDYLKIDGLLVRDVTIDRTSRVIVKSIIDIAHTLNIQTVCDRIEDQGVLDAVRELGADYAQGFAIQEPFVLSPNFPGAGAAGDALHKNVG